MARTKQTARKSTGGKATRPSESAPRGLKSSIGKGKAKRSMPMPAPRSTTIKAPRAARKAPRSNRDRYRPQRALQEICKYQATTHNLISRASFQRTIREILFNSGDRSDYRIQRPAIEALQEASEAFLAGLFEDAYMCTLHAKRVTLFAKDMTLARRLRGDVIEFITNKEGI